MWFEISWSFGTLGPLDLGTLRHRHSWTSSSCNTFTYFSLHLFTSSVLFHLLFSFSMVLIWGGGVVTLENEIRWTIDLYIDLKKLCSGYVESWDLLLLILPRYSTLLPNLLRTLSPPSEGSQMTNQIIHEDISILFCSEKLPGSWWWHCNYSFNLQVQVSKRFEIVLDIETFIVYVELTWTHPGPNLHPTWTLPAPDLDPTWTGAWQ